MAQYDLHLIQNTAGSGTEFTEKTIEGTANSLVGFDASQAPDTVTATASSGGIRVNSSALEIYIDGLTPEITAAPADTDYFLFSDAGTLSKIQYQYLLGGADAKVGVDSGATPDYLGAAYNDGALRTDNAQITYTDGGNYVTLALHSNVLMRQASAPSSAADTGTQWTFAIDNDYLYVCVDTDTWKRTTIATWS